MNLILLILNFKLLLLIKIHYNKIISRFYILFNRKEKISYLFFIFIKIIKEIPFIHYFYTLFATFFFNIFSITNNIFNF